MAMAGFVARRSDGDKHEYRLLLHLYGFTAWPMTAACRLIARGSSCFCVLPLVSAMMDTLRWMSPPPRFISYVGEAALILADIAH